MKLNEEQRIWLENVRREWLHRLQPASTPLGRHVFDVGAKIPGRAVTDARVFASRLDALDSLPKNGVVAEVGTQSGFFAEHILSVASPVSLHLFDLEFDTLRRERPSIAVDPRVLLHQGDSSIRLAQCQDASFDWIYIDGDHTLDGVRKDTDVAISKLKPDGVLVFNDYTVWSILEMDDYGVVPIVNDLIARRNWNLVYIALHPLMYCDVAVSSVSSRV